MVRDAWALHMSFDDFRGGQIDFMLWLSFLRGDCFFFFCNLYMLNLSTKQEETVAQ